MYMCDCSDEKSFLVIVSARVFSARYFVFGVYTFLKLHVYECTAVPKAVPAHFGGCTVMLCIK